MFVRSGREAPSVALTRVLRTHRKNSVENFRLHERVKTIDYESQHNYSQISDEIDGVRQNLVKIKGIKKNVGVSVERRKLLRDKGLRILPSKQNGNGEYFTVRTSEGKDVKISCSDFYDGDAMRKRLSISTHESAPTPCLEVENSDSEELIDSASGESRPRRNTIADLRSKEFRYRNITPPLRPGSRRNFKDVEEKNSEDEEKLLENISSMERKYGVLRAQTAYFKRDKQVTPRPRSRTFPGSFQTNEAGMTPRRKLSRKSSGASGNKRKKSRVNNSASDETNTPVNPTEEPPAQTDSKIQPVRDDNVVLEETISLSPSVRPKIRPRSMTVAPSPANSGLSRTVVGMRRMSLDPDKPIQLPPKPSEGKWFQPDTPESSPRGPTKSAVTISEDNEKVDRKFSQLSGRKVSWKDNVQDNDNSRNSRRGRLRINGPSNYEGRAQSAPHSRPSVVRNQTFPTRKVSKIKGRRSSQDFVYDARPDKTLSKGYVTMQMTIGNKQVKVYVPKFSPGECLDDVVHDRARAKSAVKAVGSAGGIGRPLTGNKR